MAETDSVESMFSDLIVLDTHVWIWLMSGSSELVSSPCLQTIESAVKQAKIRIPAISVWEVAMLEASERIRLTIDCLDWIKQALSAPGISMVPLTPEIAVQSTRLPGNFHGDPADRMIVATARRLDAFLITQDQRILEYGQKEYVKTLAV